MLGFLVWFSIAAGAGLWLLGAASRPRRWGNLVLGLIIFVGGLFAAWRNRQQLGRFALWVILVGSSTVFLLSLLLLPKRAAVVLLLMAAAGLFWLGTDRSPLARRLDGRTLTQALQDRMMAQAVQQAARQVLDGVQVAGPVREIESGTAIPVELPAGTTVDQLPEDAVASALAKTMPVAAVDVVRNASHADRATIITHDQPKRDPFEVLAEVDNTWAFSGGDGYDPVPLGPAIHPITGKLGIASWDLRATPHLLVAGTTGAGKTGLQHAIFAELAHRKHVQIVGLDPDAVEFAAYQDRALFVAKGAKECYEALQWVLNLMDTRQAFCERMGQRAFKVGVHGPLVVVMIDEVAAVSAESGYFGVSIPDPSKDDEDFKPSKLAQNFQGWLGQITARARKWGIRVVVGTQQPAAKLFADTMVRNNFGARIGMRMVEAVGTSQILGAGAPNCRALPKTKGVAYMLDTASGGDDLFVPMRGALLVPAQYVDDPDEALGVAAREVAFNTRHLRDERLFYELQEAA